MEALSYRVVPNQTAVDLQTRPAARRYLRRRRIPTFSGPVLGTRVCWRISVCIWYYNNTPVPIVSLRTYVMLLVLGPAQNPGICDEDHVSGTAAPGMPVCTECSAPYYGVLRITLRTGKAVCKHAFEQIG